MSRVEDLGLQSNGRKLVDKWIKEFYPFLMAFGLPINKYISLCFPPSAHTSCNLCDFTFAEIPLLESSLLALLLLGSYLFIILTLAKSLPLKSRWASPPTFLKWPSNLVTSWSTFAILKASLLVQPARLEGKKFRYLLAKLWIHLVVEASYKVPLSRVLPGSLLQVVLRDPPETPEDPPARSALLLLE